jgi:hypothetical protein
VKAEVFEQSTQNTRSPTRQLQAPATIRAIAIRLISKRQCQPLSRPAAWHFRAFLDPVYQKANLDWQIYDEWKACGQPKGFPAEPAYRTAKQTDPNQGHDDKRRGAENIGHYGAYDVIVVKIIDIKSQALAHSADR